MSKSEFAKNRPRVKGRFIKLEQPSGLDRVAYRKKYYQEHKEHKRLVALEWGRKNKEKRKIIKDRWRAKNRERTNFLTRRYIYRKKNAAGSHTLEQIQKLYSQAKLCIYCNINKPDTIDHLVPLSRGGSNDVSNLVAVCRSCNSKKGNKMLYEFMPILNMMLEKMRV